MPTIQDIRAQYPQYKDMSDQQLADALYAKHYSDMPKDEYYQKIRFSQPKQAPSEGVGTQIYNALKNIPLSAGHELGNIWGDVLHYAGPKGAEEQWRSLLGTGPSPGVGTTLGKIGGDVLGYLGPRELAAGAALPAMMQRLAAQAGYGALTTPESPSMGATTGLGLGALGEVAPSMLRGIGKAAEFMNPVQFTKNLAGNIKQNYQKASDLASSFYEPIRQRFGTNNIYAGAKEGESAYKDFAKDKESIKDYFDSDLKKMHKNFMADPNFETAHKLQSQMGTAIGEMKGAKDYATRNAVKHLQEGRSLLRNDMLSFLNKTDPEAAQRYQTGTDIYREQVVPYRSNKTINNIVEGRGENVEPNQLLKALKNVKENKTAPQNHYLQNALVDLSKKSNKGKLAEFAASTAGGAGLGEFMAPGMGGLTMGSLAGKMLGPSAIKAAQNPELLKALQAMQGPYYAGTMAMQPILSSLLSNRNQENQ